MRKGFWDFCCDHPIIALVVIIVALSAVCDIVGSITGHFSP